MKTSLYSVYDTIAETFNKPFVEHSHATAERAFRSSVIDQAHKDDYVLFYLGDYDDSNGSIDPVVPVRILSGLDVKVID